MAGAQSHHKHRKHSVPKVQSVGTQRPLASGSSDLIQIDVTPTHALNRFAQNVTLGSSVDAIGIGGRPDLFSASNVAKMLTAGAGSISYRLYTELNVEDWHWNPAGTWSDSANHQGYFVGSSTLQTSIADTYGYLLTHRGDTFDQGDNLDYSRITDGDNSTYWKSSPYLTSTYTHDSDSLHPQWIIVDLGSSQNVNAVQIHWANPYAISYTVQYWNGDDAMYDPTNGQWVNFPSGIVTNGTGGVSTLKLASSAISAEFVRVLMTQSSNTYDTHGTSDPRNKMGYAVFELGVGTLSSGGSFNDLVSHSADQTQTTVYVSSNDPWHDSSGQNQSTEQVGLDFIFDSALSQALPMTIPVPMVYSTPENAVAEVAYLTQRHYPVLGIELGEEPDGQFMTPEDYGAFYVQWAAAIHASYPSEKIGGPVLSSSVVQTWADSSGDTDWMKRFVAYLITHSALSSLSFVSVEHYPFDATTTDWSLIAQEPGLVTSLFADVAGAHVPKTVPIYVTEYNFNASPTEVTVDLMGALWQAVFVGEFLNHGGQGAFYYQYLPWQLDTDGAIWGITGMITADSNNQANGTTAQYFSNQMLCEQWCVPGPGMHLVLPVTANVKDPNGNPVVFAYALARPDGRYSVMLVNSDSASHTVHLVFNGRARHYFNGLGSRRVLDASNYIWHPNGANGYAKPNGPIESSTLFNNEGSSYPLPAQSITVLTGRIQ